MQRRAFIALFGGAAAWPLAARAQRSARLPLIGVLGGQSPESNPPILSFREGLKELGYIEGQNVSLEWRWGLGRPELFSKLASELVELKVDVIVAAVNAAMDSAKRVAGNTPIVGVYITDPVGAGFVENLARPEGNVTGMGLLHPEMAVKGLQLLRDALPNITRVAMLNDLTEPFRGEEPRNISLAAQKLAIQLQIIDVRSGNELPAAFETMTRDQAEALFIPGTTTTFGKIPLLAELAINHRLPTATVVKEFAAGGCLMSIGPNFVDMARNAAHYVDKILRGIKPGELPIQQPTKFELVINLKTAKALGLDIPPTVLALADQVIE